MSCNTKDHRNFAICSVQYYMSMFSIPAFFSHAILARKFPSCLFPTLPNLQIPVPFLLFSLLTLHPYTFLSLFHTLSQSLYIFHSHTLFLYFLQITPQHSFTMEREVRFIVFKYSIINYLFINLHLTWLIVSYFYQ